MICDHCLPSQDGVVWLGFGFYAFGSLYQALIHCFCVSLSLNHIFGKNFGHSRSGHRAFVSLKSLAGDSAAL